jgi:putative membrane protein
MTDQPVSPLGTTSTLPLPPPSANGSSSPPPAPSPAPEPAPAQAQAPTAARMHTRISGMRTSLIAAVVGLTVVMIFIIQNARAVNISFLGAHLRLSLAVALLLAAIAGALIMAAAGTARITQLRRIMRRSRRAPPAS